MVLTEIRLVANWYMNSDKVNYRTIIHNQLTIHLSNAPLSSVSSSTAHIPSSSTQITPSIISPELEEFESQIIIIAINLLFFSLIIDYNYTTQHIRTEKNNLIFVDTVDYTQAYINTLAIDPFIDPYETYINIHTDINTSSYIIRISHYSEEHNTIILTKYNKLLGINNTFNTQYYINGTIQTINTTHTLSSQ